MKRSLALFAVLAALTACSGEPCTKDAARSEQSIVSKKPYARVWNTSNDVVTSHGFTVKHADRKAGTIHAVNNKGKETHVRITPPGNGKAYTIAISGDCCSGSCDTKIAQDIQAKLAK